MNTCDQCGFENPPQMRFCGKCGARLGEESASGSAVFTPGERLGVMMGADLMERFRKAGMEARGQRRSVTILFVDLTGYTHLAESLGDEDLYELVQRFIRMLVETVHRYEGMVDKLTGDGLMALFGAPIAYENNAERALRCALDMQAGVERLSRSFPALKDENLQVHIGLNSGSVIVGGVGADTLMNYTAIGDSVNLARRLEEIACGGCVLVSESVQRQTYRLFDFEALPPVAMKGMSQPVTAYQLVGPKDRPGSSRGLEGLRAPMVGRETELSRLRAVIDRLAGQHMGSLVLVVGEGGMGKTRLVAEARSHVPQDEIRVIVGQSLTYRKAIAYWIFQDVLRQLMSAPAELSAVDLRVRLTAYLKNLLPGWVAETQPYLEALFGLEPEDEAAERIQYLDAGQLRQRIFMALRDVLVAETRRKSLLLILEDLHWADDSSLEMLLFLMESVRTEALVICALSRPFEGGAVASIVERARQRLATRFVHVQLEALEPDQSRQLLQSLLSISDLPDHLGEQIIRRAAGMPFYLEEILRSLIDSGVIYHTVDGWRLTPGAETTRIGVPESVQSLILTRFDRLDPFPRRVLQSAAVIGDRFRLAVLRIVLADMPSGALSEALTFLADREFLQPDMSGPEVMYNFRHALVSDAIYSTLLQRDRSDLHGRVGLAIEALYPNRLEGQVEVLAGHFLRSSMLDRALRYLILSGLKASAAFANDQALLHFQHAQEILDKVEHTPEQAVQVQIGLGDAQVTAGEYAAALEHYQAVEARQDISGRLRARLGRKAAVALERQGSYAEAVQRLQQAASEPDMDPVEHARVLNDLGWIDFRRGDLDEAEGFFKQALELAEPAAQYDVIASIYNRLGGIYFQRDQVERAKEFVQRSLALRERIGDVVAVARTYNNLGLLAWKQGDWDTAQENFQRSFKLQSNLGDVEGMIELRSNMGLLEIDRGSLLASRSYLQDALASAQQIGHTYQVGLAYLHLILLNQAEGDWSSLLDNAKLSLEAFQSIGVQEHLVELWAIMGLAWLGLNNQDQAVECAQKARLGYQVLGGDSSGRVEDYARLLMLDGEIALRRGDLGAAARSFRASADRFGEVADPAKRGRALLSLAEVEARRGDREQSAALVEQARAALGRAMTPADEARMKGCC